MTNYIQLDEVDIALLDELQQDSSLSNVELARRVNLAAPTVHARIRRLIDLGYIQRYVALLDRERMGFDMLCFIQVSLQVHQSEEVNIFREAVAQMPEVLECYHVTGGTDYLLKVVIRHQKDLQRFLMERITPIRGIARIQTSLALTEIKATTVLPLKDNHDD